MIDKILCKDCKFSKVSWFNRMIDNQYAFKCSHPDSWYQPSEDRVTGKPTPGYFQSCSTMRGGLSDGCGKEGKLWSPRNKKDLFKFIKHVSV
jgi:hypothetical protein